MKQLTINAALAAIFSILIGLETSAQSAGEAIVIEIAEFNSQKNLDIYSLFNTDEEVDVINSCDALGWVVLRASNSALSKSMVRAYVEHKILDVIESDSYTVIEDKQPYDVLDDCRAEMQRLTESK